MLRKTTTGNRTETSVKTTKKMTGGGEKSKKERV